jgi:uncharacterized membrane protein (UPF0127 family)
MAKIYIGKAKRAGKSFETDLAQGPASRGLGIMWKGTPLRKPFTKPLFLEFARQARLANATHSFFCFVPYDAVFIGQDWKVVEVMHAIPGWNPWIVPKKPFRYLLEMPSGLAKKYGLKAGSRIALKQ